MKTFLGAVVPWLITGALVAACGSDTTTPGQLVVVVTSDMTVPKDVDTIGIEVVSLGAVRFSNTFPINDQGVLLPATLSLVVGKDPSTPVTLRVTGGHAGAVPRVLREVITTVPSDRVAMLRVPLSWLSDGSAKADPVPDDPLDKLGVVSTCPGGQTSVVGTCVDQNLDVRGLPTYGNDAVYGAATLDQAVAFDVVSCFSGGATVTVDASDCSIPAPPFAHDHWNVALKLAQGKDGFCGGGACYIPLDNIPVDRALLTGWIDAGNKIKLPPGVCARRAAGLTFDVVTSGACVTKLETMAPCDSGSAVKTCGIKSANGVVDGGSGDGGASLRLTRVALGTGDGCALRAKGDLFCWGSNANGQLGLGGAAGPGPFPPQRVTPPSAGAVATDVAVSVNQVCAVYGGLLYCAGNLTGLYPIAQSSTMLNFNALALSTKSPAIALNLNGTRVCALLPDDTVRCWGDNTLGALGPNGPDGSTTTPIAIPGVAEPSGQFAMTVSNAVCAGGPNPMCWGNNANGELGRGTGGGNDPTPAPLADGGQKTPLGATAGGDTAECAVDANGTAFCWGTNGFGELGNGSDGGVTNATPGAVASPHTYVDICTGIDFACAATSMGTVDCWGDNSGMEIGRSGGGKFFSPTAVTLPTGFPPPDHVACGRANACAWESSSGRVACWGGNTAGEVQLGGPSTMLPTEVILPP